MEESDTSYLQPGRWPSDGWPAQQPATISSMTSASDWHWHARAWMARQRWAATRDRLARWMASIDAAPDVPQELILLGGSAGWMMSPAFLARFKSILMVDIDPWAPRLFRLRHGATLRRHAVRLDFLCGDVHELLDQALAAQPQACVLFDNFLGLDSIYTRNLEVTARRMRGIRQRMRGRLWGSVHDRLSGPGTADWRDAACWARDWTSRSGHELPQQAFFASVQAQGPWLDHHTEHVLPPGLNTHLIAWPIVPGRWHWLEAGWVEGR